jgi:hypothetical protein
MGTNSEKVKKHLTLQDLIDRAEIRDVLMRYLRGVDRVDLDLIRSSFHPDAEIGFPADVYDGSNLDGFINFLRKELASFKRTNHFVGNLLIELDGDVAYSELYLFANHESSKAHKWAGAFVSLWARYVDKFERRNGEWRIASRKLIIDWQRTDTAGGWREIPPEQLGRRDGTDPVQQR